LILTSAKKTQPLQKMARSKFCRMKKTSSSSSLICRPIKIWAAIIPLSRNAAIRFSTTGKLFWFGLAHFFRERNIIHWKADAEGGVRDQEGTPKNCVGQGDKVDANGAPHFATQDNNLVDSVFGRGGGLRGGEKINVNQKKEELALGLLGRLGLEGDLMNIMPWEKMWHLKNFFLNKESEELLEYPPEYLHELRSIAKLVIGKTNFMGNQKPNH
jgi:hypothetical protein